MHAKLFIRLNFHRSKSAKISASMPTESKAVHRETDPPNRRASLPHNLKIPAITITPSSPSPGKRSLVKLLEITFLNGDFTRVSRGVGFLLETRQFPTERQKPWLYQR